MTAHQTDSNLQILFDRLVVQSQHAFRGWAVDSDGLLHEYVQALFDCIGIVHPAKCGRSCQDHNIARLQNIHGLLVSVEADEASFWWHVQFAAFAVFFAQVAVAGIEVLLEHIGHGHDLDRPVIDRQSITGRSGSASAAADQSDGDRVVLRNVHAGGNVAQSGCDCGCRCRGLEEVSS